MAAGVFFAADLILWHHSIEDVGAGLATVALIIATAGAAAPWAYIATGFALAPIFPTGIVWLAKLRPGDSRATSWLFPAASIGGIAGPGAIGIVIAQAGVSWAPAVLAVVAIGMTFASSSWETAPSGNALNNEPGQNRYRT